LQNGIDISEDASLRGEGQERNKLVLNQPENGFENEESITSFGEGSAEDEKEKEELDGDDSIMGNALGKLYRHSDEKLLKHLDVFQEVSSVTLSDFTKPSGDTTASNSQPDSDPNSSWRTLEALPFNGEAFKVRTNNTDNTRGVGLEAYLQTKIEASDNKAQNLETDTWAIHSVVENALGKNSEKAIPLPVQNYQKAPPPPPPMERVQSAPAPSGRKRNKSLDHRPGRSKSNGTRRRRVDCRLSDISAAKPTCDLSPPPPPEESMNELSPVDSGRRKKTTISKKSPGTRRTKQK
jgi:hypothetical protein